MYMLTVLFIVSTPFSLDSDYSYWVCYHPFITINCFLVAASRKCVHSWNSLLLVLRMTKCNKWSCVGVTALLSYMYWLRLCGDLILKVYMLPWSFWNLVTPSLKKVLFLSIFPCFTHCSQMHPWLSQLPWWPNCPKYHTSVERSKWAIDVWWLAWTIWICCHVGEVGQSLQTGQPHDPTKGGQCTRCISLVTLNSEAAMPCL